MKQLNLYYLGGGGPSPAVPDGKTITPINDVTIWQQCAGLQPVYSTLSEILNDSGYVRALMLSNNAVDYMVRSTDWITPSALVPAMTSATTPSGSITASGYESGFDPYKAFDGDNTGTNNNRWVEGINVNDCWIQYEFPEAVDVGKMCLTNNEINSITKTQNIKNFDIECSNDGSIYDNIGSFVNGNNNLTNVDFVINTRKAYTYYRIHSYSNWGHAIATTIHEIQFYTPCIVDYEIPMKYIGASDYAVNTLSADPTWCKAIGSSSYKVNVWDNYVPTMSSDTAPIGRVIYSKQLDNTDYAAWHSFDNNAATIYHADNNSDAAYPFSIGYQFTTSSHLYCIFTQYPETTVTNTVKLQVSDDGTTWTDIKTITEATGNTSGNYYPAIVDTDYLYYRLYYISGTGYAGGGRPALTQAQFYCRTGGGVQTWLHAAGITDKPYTTLAEVLNDTTTLTALMNSTDAVDYLVTVKGWISIITNNEAAMTAIGNNNYASNTLLDNYNWRAAICSSAYFESVLNVKVPVMTSNTTPSGEAFASSEDRASAGDWHIDSYAYNAFDNNTNKQYVPLDWSTNECWVAYDFTDYVKIYKWYVFTEGSSTSAGGNGYRIKDYRLEGSNDKVTWTSYMTSIYNSFSTGDNKIVSTDSYGAYRYHRLHVLTNYAGNFVSTVFELQFYGREDV